ncbi:MAG: vWA domain-containing protein [Candidatus Woesearchaeota archaeon]
MMESGLEQELQSAFSRVKIKFGHIPLKQVCFSDDVLTAAIDMESFRIKVNPGFVQKTGMDFGEALEGILDHEVGHYVFHPYSLKRVILEHATAKKLENGPELRGFYDDVNDNLRVIVSKDKQTNIDEIYKSLPINSRVEKVLLRLYQDLTSRDFGMHEKLDKESAEALEKLKSINFLNYDPETESVEFVKEDGRRNLWDLKRFCRIMSPLFEKDMQDGNTPDNKLGNSPSVGDYSGKQIRKALKELIEGRELTPEQAKDLIKEFKDKMSEGGFPGGRYSDAPELFADRFVYESLALKYSIVLKQHPIISSDGAYPTRHEKFEVGDDMSSLDLFNSYGKVLPGLSNKWVKEEIEYHGEKEATPDLMLILDDSGSMTNPLEAISKAVLSSFVIAREYLKNGSEVGIARFSDRTTTQEFTDNKYKVLDELLRFKNGGDTVIDLKKVKSLAESNNVHDYVLITDGEIKNKSTIMQFLNSEAEKGARTYFVQIGESGEAHYEGKVKIIPVGQSDDIGKIILDDIHRK